MGGHGGRGETEREGGRSRQRATQARGLLPSVLTSSMVLLILTLFRVPGRAPRYRQNLGEHRQQLNGAECMTHECQSNHESDSVSSVLIREIPGKRNLGQNPATKRDNVLMAAATLPLELRVGRMTYAPLLWPSQAAASRQLGLQLQSERAAARSVRLSISRLYAQVVKFSGFSKFPRTPVHTPTLQSRSSTHQHQLSIATMPSYIVCLSLGRQNCPVPARS